MYNKCAQAVNSTTQKIGTTCQYVSTISMQWHSVVQNTCAQGLVVLMLRPSCSLGYTQGISPFLYLFRPYLSLFYTAPITTTNNLKGI